MTVTELYGMGIWGKLRVKLGIWPRRALWPSLVWLVESERPVSAIAAISYNAVLLCGEVVHLLSYCAVRRWQNLEKYLTGDGRGSGRPDPPTIPPSRGRRFSLLKRFNRPPMPPCMSMWRVPRWPPPLMPISQWSMAVAEYSPNRPSFPAFQAVVFLRLDKIRDIWRIFCRL